MEPLSAFITTRTLLAQLENRRCVARSIARPCGRWHPGISQCASALLVAESMRTISIPAQTLCTGVPANAKAFALNATVLPNGNPMPFLTVYPTGQPRPNASVINAFQGQIVSSAAIIPAGPNGSVDIFAFRQTHVVLEISGYFGR